MINIKKEDKEIYKLIKDEESRQFEGLELIPSENYCSQAILEANGSILTNKYSEGYPKKRYYGGQEIIDQIEEIAIERAKKLFGAEHVNVQPYSGSPANTAIYFALLNYEDTVMGLKLDHGGHITHGLKIAFSGKSYNFIPYEVNTETGMLDMDEIEKLALKHKPKLIVAGFTAYPQDIDWKRFKEIADKVGAYTMADISHTSGLIAAGVLESPVKFFDVVSSTTHKTLRGPRGAIIMCKKELAKKIDRAVFPGLQGGPHEHIIAAKAICFKEAMTEEFKSYAKQILINAKTLSKELQNHGFKLISNGTNTHLILIDLSNKGISGKEAQKALDKVNITTNKNTIPGDPHSAFDPSGLRLGTPAITTRGMKEKEMIEIAQLINKTIENKDNEAKLSEIKENVKKLSTRFQIPGIKI